MKHSYYKNSVEVFQKCKLSGRAIMLLMSFVVLGLGFSNTALSFHDTPFCTNSCNPPNVPASGCFRDCLYDGAPGGRCCKTVHGPGSLTIVKNTKGGDGAFKFDIFPTPQVVNISTSGGTGRLNIPLDATIKFHGDSYSTKETLPSPITGPGWALSNIKCVTPSEGSFFLPRPDYLTNSIPTYIFSGQTTTCTFENQKRGTLKIIKNTKGGDKDAFFNYNIKQRKTEIPNSTTKSERLTIIADTSVSPGPSSYTGESIIYLDPGQYEVSEEARNADDWTFKKANCVVSSSSSSSSSSVGIPTGDGVTNVPILPGGTTTCTFESSGQGILKIINNTIGGQGSESFDYNIQRFDIASPLVISDKLNVKPNNLVRENRLRGNEYIGSKEKDLDKGIAVYRITQKIPEGWALDSVVCQLQDGTKVWTIPTIYDPGIQGVTVGVGRTITCTFANTKKGELKIVKNVIIPPPPLPPFPPLPPPSRNNEFDYDINFISTDYLPSGLLPFYMKPTGSGCGNSSVCSIDEDCNICKADCRSCNAPPPKEPGPGYSPTRITAKPDSGDYKKRVYPGDYQIIEYPPLIPASQGSWLLNKIDCKLENGDKTGTKTNRGITDLKIYSGKITTCTFENELKAPPESGGGGGGGDGSGGGGEVGRRGGGSTPGEETKPTQ